MGATEWAFERIREAFEKEAKHEAGRLYIVQGFMLKSTDFLRRIIAPAGEQGGCYSVVSVPKLQQVSSGELHVLGFSWKEAVQLVVRYLWRQI